MYPGVGIATVYLASATEVGEGPIHAFSDALDFDLLNDLAGNRTDWLIG